MFELFTVARVLTFLLGSALLGRLTRDRISLKRTHFLSRESKRRWLFMAVLVVSITLSGLISFVVSAPISGVTYLYFAYMAALMLGHWFLDDLRPNEQMEQLARTMRTNAWLDEQINKLERQSNNSGD